MNLIYSAAAVAVPAMVINPDPPAFLDWVGKVLPFVIFLVLVASIVVFVPMMFGARRHNISQQANVVGSFSIPAITLIVFLTGLAFTVIGFFAGWFNVAGL